MRSSGGEHVLSLRDVGWSAGNVPIVQQVSFDAAPGEFIALMGRNGAGKSTVLDLIAGLRTPVAGGIALDAEPLSGWSALERARAIGHLPQAVHAPSAVTVDQVVMMGRYPHADRWFETDADRAAVERAMGACGCLEFRGRLISTLSGGERQRVLLAACLAQQPRVLLLDEPAAFLDIDQQLHCFDLLRNQAAAGVTCIAVSHDLNLALEFCTRLIVLSDRTVACDMSAEDAIGQTDWLKYFSTRLERATLADGRAWVCYR
jgi:ABC-type cobalamin/Fe3+-siderophores transport system ATPase subunit